MKKHFLTIFTSLLLVNFTFAQQSKHTTISSLSDNAYSANTSNLKVKGLNAAFSTTTSTCMSVDLPAPATWSLVNYGTGTPFAANGFVSGPNVFLDREKAMYFDVSASANASITHVYVGFSHAYTANPAKIVTLKVYDGTTTNVIGALLGSTTMTMGEIMADVAANQYSDFLFAAPINLPASKKFYCSVDITNLQWATIKDSLNIVSNTHGQTVPSKAWERQSDNLWYNYANSVSSWSLNISLLIHPFLVQSPVISNFTIVSNSICAGQSASYNSAGSTTGGSFYWDFGSAPTATSSAATPSNLFPTAGTFTTYLLTTDACGSYAVSSKTVLVKPNPTVGANPSSATVCSGGNVTLSGTGASSYVWTGGITNAVSFVSSSTLNYTVTGTAANGCTATAVSAVNVTPNPTVTANTTATSVCAGGNVTLSGSGANSYVWTGGVTNNVAFSPSSSNTYTITGTTGACSGTASINIPVNPNPTVTANTTTNTVCAGGNITLTGGGATTYTWTGGASNNVAFAPSTSTTYVVTGLTGNCTGTAAVAITVNAAPPVTANATSTLVCSGSSVTLTGGGASTYTWSGSVVDGAAFAPAGTAVYTVTGTGSNGCNKTATVNVVVSLCTGLTSNSTNSDIILYPNPNTGMFTIESKGFSASAFVEIYDNLGKLVFIENIIGVKHVINTNMAVGIYTVKITDQNTVQSIHKLIIE
jgi:hypothetical protein